MNAAGPYSDAVQGMLRYQCRHCMANPGEWCKTPSGRRPHFLHSDRFYQWRDRPDDPPVWGSQTFPPVAP